MRIVFAEQLDRTQDFSSLLFRIVHGQMGMHLTVRSYFKKCDAKQLLYFRVVFGNPPAGHEKCCGNMVVDQIVDQRLVVSRPLSHRA